MKSRIDGTALLTKIAANPVLAALNPHLAPKVEVKPEPAKDGFDSELERDFVRYCIESEWEFTRDLPNFKLVRRASGTWWTYRPDFLIRRGAEVAYVEIKPNFTPKERRIGELKISLFAAWCDKWGFTFYRVTRVSGQWQFTQQ